MPRPKLIVAIEPPNSEPTYVTCRNLDDALDVVAVESKKGRNVTTTKLSIIEESYESDRRICRDLVASWRIHGSGPRRESLQQNAGHRLGVKDPYRARTIVRLAADTTKTPAVKAWLRDDPNGKWERRADELLQQASEHPSFSSMGDDDVNGEVATMLSLLALEAVLRSKKRKKR